MLHRALALALIVLPGCAASVSSGPQAAPNPGPAAPAQILPVTASTVPAPAAPIAGAAPADEGATAAPGLAATDDEMAALDDDDEEMDGASGPSHATPKSPLLALSDADLEARYKQDPAAVGPISAGRAGAGVLVNGVQMPKGDRVLLLDPGRAWGTRETVDALTRIIDRVNERYPSSPPLPIGHLSAKNGGHLSPHVSHQSGRDADVGYYYRKPMQAFVTATADNLDMPRTWALVKAAVRETDVEMILMDRSIQRLLADYAAKNGEDPAFVDEVFQIRGKNARAPIRHIKGHHNHLHFRFHNPVAEELGRRLARHIAIPKPAPVTVHSAHTEVAGFVQHRARSGDTLVILAKRYGTTVEDIQRANGLKSVALKAGAVYRIPSKVAPKPAPGKPAVVAKKAPQKAVTMGNPKGVPQTPPVGAGKGASSPQR